MLLMDGSHKGLMGLLLSDLGHHFKDEIHTFYHGHSLIGAILSGHDIHDEFMILGTDQEIAPTPWPTCLLIVFLSSIHSTGLLYGIQTSPHNIWSERSSTFESQKMTFLLVPLTHCGINFGLVFSYRIIAALCFDLDKV
jgi:hypothetical protein